jgi:hypothetical protein
MSLTTAGRNEALNAVAIDTLSLHSGFPGSIGTNELTGSGYVRVAGSFGAASGGVRSLSAIATFTVGAGHTVRWVGLWGGGVFKGYAANGGSPKEFQVDVSTDYVNCPAHGLTDGMTVAFYGGTMPGGITEGTIYYVRDAGPDAFHVSPSLGGPVVDITSQPAPDCVVSRVVESVYAGANTHVINTWAIGAVF